MLIIIIISWIVPVGWNYVSWCAQGTLNHSSWLELWVLSVYCWADNQISVSSFFLNSEKWVSWAFPIMNTRYYKSLTFGALFQNLLWYSASAPNLCCFCCLLLNKFYCISIKIRNPVAVCWWDLSWTLVEDCSSVNFSVQLGLMRGDLRWFYHM